MDELIVRRLLSAGHDCVVFDMSADKILSAMRFQFGGHHEKPRG